MGMFAEHIFIAHDAGAPLQEINVAQAVAGRGLVGDRYYFGRGSFNRPQFDPHVRDVTLIAAEAIVTCNARLGTAIDAAAFRRNIVISGGDLAALKGCRFRIGTAVLRVVRSAPPCRYISRMLGEDMMRGLKGVGGIRAVIEHGGEIKKGAQLHVLS